MWDGTLAGELFFGVDLADTPGNVERAKKLVEDSEAFRDTQRWLLAEARWIAEHRWTWKDRPLPWRVEA